MTEEKKERIPFNKENIKKLLGVFRFILPYKGLFFIGLASLFISTFLVLSFPVLSGKLLDVASGDEWVLTGRDLMDRIQQNEHSLVIDNVNDVAFLLMGILLVQSVFSFVRVYVFAIVTERSVADMRQTVFTKMLNLPMKFFDKQRVGDMISRLTSDISIVQETFSITSAELFRQVTILIVGIPMIFVLVPDLAIFMLLIFPPVILVAVYFGRSIKKLSKRSQEHLGNTNVIVNETLQSILVVKAFTNEWFEIGRYVKSLKETVKVALQAAKFRGAFISFIVLALFGAIVAIMWKGASLVQQGTITSGDLVTFVFVTMFIGASIGGIGDMFGQLQRAIGASQRILEVLEEENEPVGKPDFKKKVNGHVQFKNVTFQYPETQKQVIKNVDFEIKPGQKVALVGPSGAGKSTITQLLLRFYPIDQGSVLLDGEEIDSYDLSSYRANIGVVPQEVMLFGGTVRENILYGNTNASEEELINAAEKAHVLEFINNLEQGWETMVGERGVKLSGGQRQRIAIARAILKDPAILILDEATSSLDAESELLVQKALESLMENRTTLIIAHRLSTIRSADKIVVLQGGEIVEEGNHDLLSQKNDGLYKHLLSLQFQS